MAGETYVIFGKPDGRAVEISEVEAGRGGFAIEGSWIGHYSGWSVSGAGDVNGDGLADLLVGAPGASFGEPSNWRRSAGESFVVFGKPDGARVDLAEVLAGQGGFAVLGIAEGDHSGSRVSGAGDVNGDGLADLLISAYLASPAGRHRAGESYVVFGKPGGAAVDLAEVQAGRGGGFAIRGVVAGDAAGSSISEAGDVNSDGFADLLLGAPWASPGQRSGAGEAYVVFGKPDGRAVELSEVQAARGGFAVRGSAGFDFSGSSVSGTGDVNGDGFADLLIGAPDGDPGGRDRAGETHVVFGKPGGAAVDLAEVQAGRGGFAIRGVAPGDRSGWSVSGAGDVNGDGLADLLVGAPWAEPGGRLEAGESYVVFGNPDGRAVELSEVQAARGGFAIRGSAVRDSSGWSVSGAGDVNGDGFADLLIGAPLAHPGDRWDAGESYVVFGKSGGAGVELSEVQAGRGGFALRGIAAADSSGWSVSGAGDVNGDGLADLLVGAPGAGPGGRLEAGEAYVIFGKPDGRALELSEVEAGRGGFVIRGAGVGDAAGASVSGAGDVDGDGLADLLAGAPYASPGGRDGAGESYVVFGKPDGAAVELSEVEAGRGGFAIRGSAGRDRSGWSVSGAGDMNGDGLAELLVGARWASPGDRPVAGAAYVVFGKPDGTAVELSEVEAGRGGFAMRGSAAYDGSGRSVSGAADVNGDGLPDLLVAAGLQEARYPRRSAAAYVVFGRPEAPPVRFRRGAVRGEDRPDLADGIQILKHILFRAEVPCLDAADANDSGNIEWADAVGLLRYLFQGDVAPPAPGPVECGPDPTEDDLGCARPPRGC